MVKHDGLIYIVYRAIQKALFIGLGLSELKGLFGLGRGMCSAEYYSEGVDCTKNNHCMNAILLIST